MRLFHFHRYKIIVSMYRSFHFRDVIVQCEKCGKKKVRRNCHVDFIYPFPTAVFMDEKEFQEILNSK